MEQTAYSLLEEILKDMTRNHRESGRAAIDIAICICEPLQLVVEGLKKLEEMGSVEVVGLDSERGVKLWRLVT